jgi:hypothetical protein
MTRKVYRCPFFDSEGRLQAVSGEFDSLDITLDLHPSLRDITIPEKPDQEQVSHSADMVRELNREFPYRRSTHQTLARGMGFLPFSRPMLSEAVPIHLIESPESGCTVLGAGVGKTLQAKLVQILAGERDCHTALSRQMPTMEVDLKCYFLTKSPVTVFDHFGSGKHFTKPPMLRIGLDKTWEFRPGRGTKPQVFANRNIFVVTGDNKDPVEQVFAHAVSIWMECKNPHRREFDKRLPGWARENLRDLVIAHLTLIQNWIAQGRPLFIKREKPGFREYSQIIGGILQVNGLGEDFLLDEIPTAKEQVA